MNAKEFMDELYKGVPADKATYLFTRPDNATYPYTIGRMDQMLEKAIRLTKTKDVYFGLHHSADDIDHIEMHTHNRVLFVFADGHAEEHFWKDHSRKDSWDADKRKKAAEKTKQQHLERKERTVR